MIGQLLSMALLSTNVTANPSAASATAVTGATGQAARPVQTLQRMTFRGTVNVGNIARAGAAAAAKAPLTPSTGYLEVRRNKRGNNKADFMPAMSRRFAIASAAVSLPTPRSRGVIAPDAGFVGFPGITHADQRNAGAGIYTNTQFSLEPPDQALCVGNNYVVEAVNNALAVYTSGGALASPAIPTSQFFGVAPEVVRPSGPYGPFLSDPKCYFDRQTQRWFVTELEFATNPSTGAFGRSSSQLIAISQTSDPTGSYNVFSFDTTDYSKPGCPCFGDQPLIGADANGFYVSTNEFPISGPGFNGSQIYAFSKLSLALGIVPTVVHIDAGAIASPDPGGLWYSIQPATAPDLKFTQRNGTEYFLSALDFSGAGDNRIAAWALTNTASLSNVTPRVALENVVIRSEAYIPPPPAAQKPGPTPLGTSLGAPLELINTNDDRMNQVVFAQNRLWSGVNTAVNVGGSTTAGSAYFAVEPSMAGGKLAARVATQGYVAVAGQNTVYPSIGVNANGTALLACTLVGPKYFPSAAYVPLTNGHWNVRLAGPGAAPDDGFTAYAAYGGNGVARWGDYSAAVADERGAIWFGAEYIPNTPRTLLANWGTFIGQVPGSI